MPDPDVFMKEFKIKNGTRIGSYKIDSFHVKHESVVRYNEYSYPIHITMLWDGEGKPNEKDAENMVSKFKKYVSKIRIILSESGRSYKASFSWPLNKYRSIKISKDYTKVEIECNGHSKRVSRVEADRVEETGTW